MESNGTYTYTFSGWSPEVADTVIGDVNGDGIITIKDISEIKKLLAGALGEGDVAIANCDVSGDGMVTIKDLQELKKMLA